MPKSPAPKPRAAAISSLPVRLRQLARRVAKLEAQNRHLRAGLTQHREKEKTRRDSARRYRELFEHANDAIIIFEPVQEIVLEANRRALRLYGFKRSELVGRSLLTISAQPRTGRRRIRETLRRGRLPSFESVQYRKDRTPIVLEITAARIDYNGRRAILSINRDVTRQRRAEEALRESEQRLRAAREASLDAVYVLESRRNRRGRITDFRYVDVNRRGAELVSCRPEALVGRNLCEVFPAARRTGFLKKFAHVVETRQPLLEDFSIEVADIKASWLQQQVVPLEDGIVITTRDISKSKQVEQEMRRRESELSEAQRVGRIGSWIWDIGRDHVTWTAELYRITGLDPARPAPSYAGQARLYTPESWRRLNQAVQACLRRGTPYELDLEIHRPDGKACWITARGEAEHDARGRICRLRGTVHDITERKRFEQALSESEQRLRAAREASLDAFIVFESLRNRRGRIVDFRCIDANQQGLEFAQVPREQLIGSRLCERFPVVRTGGFFARYVRVVETGRSMEEEFPMDGSYFKAKWVHHQVVKLGDGFASVTRDITDRKQAEVVLKALPRRIIEAQEAERRRVARELHDSVSQLLASLRYRLHALEDGLPVERKDLAAGAQGMVERALGEVRRISHGLRPSELDDLGLAAALRALVLDFKERTGMEVVLQCPPTTPRLPIEIQEVIYRIMQEALTNIERHAQARRIGLRLTLSATSARLRIQDDGQGLKSQGRPTGLGLVHMRERAELAGGTFALTTIRGQGTKIDVHLPIPHESLP